MARDEQRSQRRPWRHRALTLLAGVAGLPGSVAIAWALAGCSNEVGVGGAGPSDATTEALPPTDTSPPLDETGCRSIEVGCAALGLYCPADLDEAKTPPKTWCSKYQGVFVSRAACGGYHQVVISYGTEADVLLYFDAKSFDLSAVMTRISGKAACNGSTSKFVEPKGCADATFDLGPNLCKKGDAAPDAPADAPEGGDADAIGADVVDTADG